MADRKFEVITVFSVVISFVLRSPRIALPVDVKLDIRRLPLLHAQKLKYMLEANI